MVYPKYTPTGYIKTIRFGCGCPTLTMTKRKIPFFLVILNAVKNPAQRNNEMTCGLRLDVSTSLNMTSEKHNKSGVGVPPLCHSERSEESSAAKKNEVMICGYTY